VSENRGTELGAFVSHGETCDSSEGLPIMTVRSFALSTALGLAALACIAPPAQARFDIGLGSVLGNSGISVGSNYRLGGWNDRFGSYIHLDASRYVNRRKKRDGGDRQKEDRRKDERVRVQDNVRLNVSPSKTWVYLNGVRIDADGREKLSLPEGRYRLEFVRPGYRTEVAELNVQPGIRYDVQRKLTTLQPGEEADIRIDEPGRALSVEEALRSFEPAARENLRPGLEQPRVEPKPNR